MQDSIIVACDAGIPVFLLATEELALQLGPVAEELLILGAEVDVITNLDRDPEQLTQVLEQLRDPGLFAMCSRADEVDVGAVTEIFERDSMANHRWLNIEVGDDVAASVLAPIREALADLQRLQEDVATIERIDPDEVSNICELPTPPHEIAEAEDAAMDAALASLSCEAPIVRDDAPVCRPTPPTPKAPGMTPRSKPSIPWKFAVVGATLGTALVFAVNALGTESAPRDVASDDPPSELVASESTPAAVPVERVPSRREPPDPVVFEAQGPDGPPSQRAAVSTDPAPPSTALKPGRLDPLGRALAQGKTWFHEGLLVTELKAGDRTWHEAMTACRKRPFFGFRRWRVPTLHELRVMARAGALEESTIWSSTRSDHAGTKAFAIEGGRRTVRLPKSESAQGTLCVRPRPEGRQTEK